MEGTITLRHDGSEPLTLAPYEVHAFDGGSETVSFGRCRDFNLMLRKGMATGSLTPLTAGSAPVACPLQEGDFALLYCAEGNCTVDMGDVTHVLLPGESLLLEALDALPLTFRGPARLMLAQMKEA